MKNRQVLLGIIVMGLAAPVFSAEKKMSAEEQAAMAQMQKYGTPGEAHKRLDPLAGRWTFTTRMWMKAGEKPQDAKGTMDSTWIYGNRFLKREFKSRWGDQPDQSMEGIGYSGFDNIRGEYQEVWLGTMGTGIMLASGTYDAASKIFKIAGTGSCAMTGEKSKAYRAELKIIDNDNHVLTMYDRGPDGKEFTGMVETYKRVK